MTENPGLRNFVPNTIFYVTVETILAVDLKVAIMEMYHNQKHHNL